LLELASYLLAVQSFFYGVVREPPSAAPPRVLLWRAACALAGALGLAGIVYTRRLRGRIWRDPALRERHVEPPSRTLPGDRPLFEERWSLGTWIVIIVALAALVLGGLFAAIVYFK
jgi:hypothetical protein